MDNKVIINVNKLLNKKIEILDKIVEIQELQKKYKLDLKKVELEIFDSCNHKWVRDRTVAHDDPIKYYCKICGLWRRRSLYEYTENE